MIGSSASSARRLPAVKGRRSGSRLSGRAFEGWQVGLTLVVLAGLTAAIVAPRAGARTVVPLPWVDAKQQREEFAAADRAAEAATRELLPFEVRRLGEHVRRYGHALASRDPELSRSRLRDVAQSVGPARAHGDESILRLRAVQTELFLRALARWERTGVPDDDLAELGGDFIAGAAERGWVRRGRIVLDPFERATLFRVRWTKIAGLLEVEPFAPSPNEWRAYFRALLRHATDDAESLSASAEAAERWDPSYPGDLARGIAAHRAKAYSRAASLFRAHLERHPNGPWGIRARNHLADALAKSGAP